MFATLASFSSLFTSTLVMLLGVGLFNVYMGLKLSADGVSEVWIGALLSAYYFGLVVGGRVGHMMIVRVGHVRAFAAAAAACSVMVLAQTLIDHMAVWLLLRAVAGAAMAVQLIVIESWLNEQIENQNRGRVFSFYLVMSGLGTAIGQMAIMMYPTLDLRPLTLVAICHVVGLIPIVWTVRLHPAPQLPAPLDFGFFFKVAPAALITLFLSGNISAAFYALAPVYVVGLEFSTNEVALFMSTAVGAGLLAQWPIGWLSDRVGRERLIQINGIVLAVITILLWGWFAVPYWLLLVVAAISGVVQFTLYPLAGSYANDLVSSQRRVSLSAVLVISYAIGACLGPLICGYIMRAAGENMFYVFMTGCSLLLVLNTFITGKLNARTTRQQSG